MYDGVSPLCRASSILWTLFFKSRTVLSDSSTRAKSRLRNISICSRRHANPRSNSILASLLLSRDSCATRGLLLRSEEDVESSTSIQRLRQATLIFSSFDIIIIFIFISYFLKLLRDRVTTMSTRFLRRLFIVSQFSNLRLRSSFSLKRLS